MLKPKLALLDIDGVLADDRHRVHYALKKQWFSYFDHANMGLDPVWPQGRRLFNRLLVTGWTVDFLTGRREDRRVLTELWLRANRFGDSPTPRMRPMASKVPLANLKLEVIRALVESNAYRKVVLFDDDPEVIRLVQEQLGKQFAVHCTWHIKQKALVRAATA